MKILADTWSAFDALDQATFAHAILHALPKACPEDTFLYLEETDQSQNFSYPNVHGINPLDEPTGDVYFSPGATTFDGDIPKVVTILNVDHLRFPLKFWYHFGRTPKDHLPAIIEKADKLLVTHQATSKILQNHYAVQREKIAVVGHGPPLGNWLPGPVDEVTRRITKEVYGRERSYFLVPLTGHPSDNLDRLLAAYRLFRNRCPERIMLLLSGDETHQTRVERKAVKTHPFKDDITWLPELSSAERRKVTASARAILYPSLSSRFPIPVVQAWAAHVPVLYTDNDILRGAGALVQGEDINSMAEGMVSLVTTPFLASGLVDNGKRRLQDFNWEDVAEKVAGVLREVGDQSSPRSSEQ